MEFRVCRPTYHRNLFASGEGHKSSMSLNKRLHHGWIVLFKVGGRAHLEELRKVGLLFMRSSAHFSELERSTIMDPVRADKFEGTDWIFHPKRHTIDFEGPIALDVHGNPQNIKFTTPLLTT